MKRIMFVIAGILAFSAVAVAVVTATPQPPKTRIDPRMLAPSVGCLDAHGIVTKMVPNPLLQPPIGSDQNLPGIC